jgi:hypothetical protein
MVPLFERVQSLPYSDLGNDRYRHCILTAAEVRYLLSHCVPPWQRGVVKAHVNRILEEGFRQQASKESVLIVMEEGKFIVTDGLHRLTAASNYAFETNIPADQPTVPAIIQCAVEPTPNYALYLFNIANSKKSIERAHRIFTSTDPYDMAFVALAKDPEYANRIFCGTRVSNRAIGQFSIGECPKLRKLGLTTPHVPDFLRFIFLAYPDMGVFHYRWHPTSRAILLRFFLTYVAKVGYGRSVVYGFEPTNQLHVNFLQDCAFSTGSVDRQYNRLVARWRQFCQDIQIPQAA